MKTFVILIGLYLVYNCNAPAQFIIDFSPKATRIPRELFQVEHINHASTKVTDQFQFGIDDSSIQMSENIASLDFSYVFYAKSRRTLSYQGFEASSDMITTGNSYAVTKKDLPTELTKEYGYIGFPVWIGDSRFNLFYGQLTLTDGKDISKEDVVRFFDIEYYLTPNEDSTWLIGWYYADAFGGIYNVPFLGYVSETTEVIALQLVIPVKWSVEAAFQSGWVLTIGQQIEGEAYRLTEDDPWNSAVFAFSGIKSLAGIGYHFSNGWYIKVEGGTLVNQKIHFYEESISISSAEISEEAFLSDDLPLMELTLADTSFVGISLAWAF